MDARFSFSDAAGAPASCTFRFPGHSAAQHTRPAMNLRFLIAVLTAMQFTHLVDFVIMMPLGPRLMRDLSCTPSEFSSLVAAYTIASGVAAALAGSVLDRFGRKTALLTCFGGMTLATAACGWSNTYETLLFARIAAGACGGLVGALTFAIIGERVPWEKRGRASGVVMSAFSLASIIGIPIGMGLAEVGRWQTPFLVLATLGVVVWFIAAVTLPTMAEHRTGPARSLLRTVHTVFAEAAHRHAFVLTISLTFAGFTVIPLLATYLVTNAGVAELHVGWFYGLGGLVTVVTGPWIGRLADRFGKRRVFIIVATLSLIPILVCTHLPRVGEGLALAAGVLFITLVSGRFVPAMAMITQAARPDVRGAFQAYHTAVQSLASGAAVLIAGLLVTTGANGELQGYGTVGWIAAAATVIAIAASFRLATPAPSDLPPRPPDAPGPDAAVALIPASGGEPAIRS